uniref:Uncharacterized protein n=1 Tax=Dromaius novaehollandiae TaxID=8790 RepID=A0A8C4K7C5_DRONO
MLRDFSFSHNSFIIPFRCIIRTSYCTCHFKGGPDICGSETKKVHVILNYKNKPHPIKKSIRCKVDGYTHLYTLIIRPDQTYEVKIDNEMVASGNLEDDLDFLPPRKINDPRVKKPSDWDDRVQIDDPNDSWVQTIYVK